MIKFWIDLNLQFNKYLRDFLLIGWCESKLTGYWYLAGRDLSLAIALVSWCTIKCYCAKIYNED